MRHSIPASGHALTRSHPPIQTQPPEGSRTRTDVCEFSEKRNRRSLFHGAAPLPKGGSAAPARDRAVHASLSSKPNCQRSGTSPRQTRMRQQRRPAKRSLSQPRKCPSTKSRNNPLVGKCQTAEQNNRPAAGEPHIGTTQNPVNQPRTGLRIFLDKSREGAGEPTPKMVTGNIRARPRPDGSPDRRWDWTSTTFRATP